MQFGGMTTCAELTMEDAEEAACSSASMRALLAWAGRIARPGEGAPKVLMAIARLRRADWVQGTPYVEIRGDASTTTLSVVSHHGIGIYEQLLPQTVMQVPVDEFTRAIRLAPQLIAPFRAHPRGDALFLAPAEIAVETASEVLATIANAQFREQTRQTTPPGAVVPRKDQGAAHTHPTVRRMVAVRPEALRRGDDDD